MLRKSTPDFRWTGRRELAAQLVADDTLTDVQIAARCGVTRKALALWKRAPGFRERVAEIVAATRERLLAASIAIKAERIQGYDARWERLNRILTERSAAEEFAAVAGGRTGLLVRHRKTGHDGRAYDEYAVDHRLLAEMRALERQAAIEVGDWTAQQEIVRPGDGSIPYPVTGRIDRVLARAADAPATGGDAR